MIGIKCKICDAKLLGRGRTLTLHMKNMHSDVREMFSCHCGKSYKLETSLKFHQKMNHQPVENKRKYECKICGNKFVYKQSLVDHYEIHQRTGRKDFACQVSTFAV